MVTVTDYHVGESKNGDSYLPIMDVVYHFVETTSI